MDTSACRLLSKIALCVGVLCLVNEVIFAMGTNDISTSGTSGWLSTIVGSAFFLMPAFTIISGRRLRTTQAERDAAFSHLIDLILDDDSYERETRCYVDSNPHIMDFLTSLVINPWYARCSFEERTRMDEEQRFAFDLILGWLARLYNEHAWVFPNVVLSMWALRCNLNRTFWRVLGGCRLLYAYETILKVLMEVGARVGDHIAYPASITPDLSRQVAIVVFDNCQINYTTNYEGSTEAGEGNYFYVFATWLICFITLATIPSSYEASGNLLLSHRIITMINIQQPPLLSIDPIWKDEATSSAEAYNRLMDDDAISLYKTQVWLLYVYIASNNEAMDILKRPACSPPGRSRITYQKHVNTKNGTAAYTDVQKILETIMYMMFTVLQFACLFVVGDQQSFCRMVWLKRMQPHQYSNIVPFIGDFHAEANFLMAMHILFYSVFVESVFRQADFCVNSIQEDWGGMELYNRYRHAYETLIVASMTYVCEVVPLDLLEKPEMLLKLAESCNTGFAMILYFLYGFGLPWLHMKRSIRGNDAKGIDSFYAMSLDVFRAAHKINYSRLIVDYFLVVCGLSAALLCIWMANRTYSDLGKAGHNGALDMADENQNKIIKALKPTSPAQINPTIQIANAIRKTDAASRNVLRVERYTDDEYSRVKQVHVDSIVAVFRRKLGATYEDVFFVAKKKSNPFGGSQCPWKTVAGFARSRGEYIRSQFETSPSFTE